MGKWIVKCLDATYDQEGEMIVLNCWFEEPKFKRIVCFARQDFHYKEPGQAPSHDEMEKTAAMFVGKSFTLVIDDDPNRTKLTESNMADYRRKMSKEIKRFVGEVNEGLSNSDRKINRKLGEILEKDKSVERIVEEELLIRAKLGDIIKDR